MTSSFKTEIGCLCVLTHLLSSFRALTRLCCLTFSTFSLLPCSAPVWPFKYVEVACYIIQKVKKTVCDIAACSSM